MQINISGKNLKVTDSLREYVEKKMGRLDRYLPNVSDVRVELWVEKHAGLQGPPGRAGYLADQAGSAACGRSFRRHVRLH